MTNHTLDFTDRIVTTDEETIWNSLVGEDCDFSSGNAKKIHFDLVENAEGAGITISEASCDVLMTLIETRVAGSSFDMPTQSAGEDLDFSTAGVLS